MPERKTPASAARKITRVILTVLVIVVFVFALKWFKNSGLLERALTWLTELGPWAPTAFVVIYVIAIVLFVPGSILTLGAGIVFGMLYGSIYVLTAATIASTTAFIIGRYFARDWIARKIEHHPKFKALDDAVAREGWKIVALVRLAPVFPFGITSYGFGLTRVPLSHYVLASLAMIPGTVMYVYFGSLIGDLAGLKRGVPSPPWVKWVIGVVTICVTLYVTRFAKRALRQRIS